MWDMVGKTALVTGGAKRLGRACVLALAQAGMNVIVHYRSSEDEAQTTADEAAAFGVDAWSVRASFSEESDVLAFTSTCTDLAGPVAVLVNSASIFPEGGLIDAQPTEFTKNFQVNAMTPLFLCRWFAGQCSNGAIINFLDTRILDYDRRHVPYHLSKLSLFQLTRMLSEELAPEIRVNGIAPGLILPPEGESAAYLERLAHTNPLQRYGSDTDIAEALLYLAGATFVTGQILYVDGGRHQRGRFYGS